MTEAKTELASPAKQSKPTAQANRPLVLRAPLAMAALAVAAGIVAGRYLAVPVGLPAVVGVLALLTAAITLRREHLLALTSAAVAVAVFCLSAAWAGHHFRFLESNHIAAFSDDGKVLATIRGQIVSSPQILPSHVGYETDPSTHFVVQVDSILGREGQWLESTGLARVTVNKPLPDLRSGQRVELVGSLRRPRPADNPGQYDWRKQQRDEGLLVKFDVPLAEGVRPLPPGNWLSQALWGLRWRLRQHVEGVDDDQAGHLLNALLIGERHPALRELNQSMQRSGTIHYLSISGSHLAIFLGFIYLLCRLLAQPQRRSAVIVLVVLAVYMILAEPQAPLYRSAIQAGCVCLAALWQRRYLALNALSLAVILLLVMEPADLFSAGFQLSFGIVLGMVLLYGPVRDLLFGRYLRQRGLVVFRKDQRVRRWLHFKAADWLMGGVAMSLVAWVVSAPLVAYHFGLFSSYAMLLSPLLVVPVTLVLIPGYISMALAWPMPNLSHFFNQLAGQAAGGLTWCVRQFERLPGLCLELRPVSVWWVLLCYLTVLAAIFHRRLPRGKLLAGALVVLLAAATAWTQWPAPRPAGLEVDLLAVGDGQCALVRTPGGKVMLIDAGSIQNRDGYLTILKPFLREEKFALPDSLLISHPDSDHYNFIFDLLDRQKLPQLMVNDAFGPAASMPAEQQTILEAARSHGVGIVELHAGAEMDLDGQTHLQVIWPPADFNPGKNRNDTSLVVKLTCQGRSILFTGDIDTKAQEELTRRAEAIKCDVLVLPHHGHWRASLPAFVEATGAKTILSSCGPIPRASETDPAQLQFFSRLDTGGPKSPAESGTSAKPGKCLFRSTAGNGWIQVHLGQSRVSMRSMR